MRIYLDNAATSWRKPVSGYKELMYKTMFSGVNPGRGTYKESVVAVAAILDTQEAIAELFNIEDASCIAFFPNATYALNTAISGYVNRGEHIVISGIEHNSVLRPVFRLGNFSIAEADENGNVTPESIGCAIKEETKLVVISHASNVCGSVQPISDIIKIAHEMGVRVLVDVAQSAGVLEIDAEKTGADMIAFSGHKGLMGPSGTGGLFVRDGVPLTPLVVGGTGSMSESFSQPEVMPDMLHSGTLNFPAICALKKGVEFVSKRQKEIFEKEKELAVAFIDGILNIEGIKVYGNIADRRNGTVAFNLEKSDCITVAERLSTEFNIKVRAGFHCAPLAHRTLGTSKTGCIRASFGYFNNNGDVKKILNAVNKIKKMGYN